MRHYQLALQWLLACVLLACQAAGDQRSSGTIETAPATIARELEALPGPPSAYILPPGDLGVGYEFDERGTFAIDLRAYASLPVFRSQEEGEDLLSAWGYQGGHQAAYVPAELEQGVLGGSPYVVIEVHLFDDDAGADAAWRAFDQYIASTGARPLVADRVGDVSSAWARPTGRVPGTRTGASLYQLLFRRQNLVAIIACWGVTGDHTVSFAERLAKLVDGNVLQGRPAPD